MVKYVQKVSVIGVLLSILLIALGTNSVGFAQSGSWSEPVNISNTPNGSWFPDLAVDSMGNVHVVWCETVWDEFQNGTEYVFYSQRQGQVWTQPNDIVAASASIHRNSIVVDTLGNLHLVFVDENVPRHPRGVYLRHAPVGAAYSAASWSDWRLLGGRISGYASDVVVDWENRLHVVYVESVQSDPSDLCLRGGCSDIFYRNSQDGGRTWSAPLNLSRSEPGTKRVGLMMDWQGNLHAFWDEGGDRYMPDVPTGVVHAMSRDGGRTWPTSTFITYTTGVPQQIVAGFDGRGQTVIAWRAVPVSTEERDRADDHVYYQVSTDNVSWSTPQPIPGVIARTDSAGYSGFDQYDMATDSAGILHFVGALNYLSAPGSRPGIFHLQWDGERWSAPELISMTSGFPEYPRIVVERGNILHVVWAIKESSSLGPQQIEVWYSTEPLTSPAWTPVPTPMPLPTPVLTLSPTAVPVTTPYPTLDGVSSGLPGGLDTESDEVARLAVALSPVVLVILLVIVIKIGRLGRLRR